MEKTEPIPVFIELFSGISQVSETVGNWVFSATLQGEFSYPAKKPIVFCDAENGKSRCKESP